MIELQRYLKENIKNLEQLYGLDRVAVRGGQYLVSKQPGYDGPTGFNSSQHGLVMMTRYATLVELDNRFGTTERDLQDRDFIERVLGTQINSRKGVEDIALDILDNTMKILRELRVQDKVGVKSDVQLISRSSELIAASALRVRDLNKGFEQVEEKVIQLNQQGRKQIP